MFIRCVCGLNIGSLYDWPAAEITVGEGNSAHKEMQRHINCACGREMVVNTAPKDEPNSEENPDKKQVISFDEIARRMGQLPNTPVENSETTTQLTVSVGLSKDESELLAELVKSYGITFKPVFKATKKSIDTDKKGKKAEQANEDVLDQAKAQQAYLEFASKIGEGIVNFSPAEAKMVRCAFTERNLFRLYPTTESDFDTDHNVIMLKRVEELKARVFSILEAEGL